MNRICSFFVFLMVVTVNVGLQADSVFSDRAAWEAALTGNLVESQYVGNPAFPQTDLTNIDGPVLQPWGVMEFTDVDGLGGTAAATFIPDASTGLDPGVLFFPGHSVDAVPQSSLGAVEGFGINYFSLTSDVTVTLFDGATVVDTLTLPATQDNLFFGWVNCSDANITRIQILPETIVVGNSIVFDVDISFGADDPADPTSREKLQAIIDDLAALEVSAADQLWVDEAIWELMCAQDDSLWVSEDRLSDAGRQFFERAFFATYFLECVSDPSLVEDSLIDIQILLGCIVDAEIEFALENPNANTNLLLYAECFEDYADQFSDAGLYLHAVILHFYAWLFANHA